MLDSTFWLVNFTNLIPIDSRGWLIVSPDGLISCITCSLGTAFEFKVGKAIINLLNNTTLLVENLRLLRISSNRLGYEHQFNLWLEGVLIQTEVPKECLEHKVADVWNFLVSEYEDAEWRSLALVTIKNFLKHLETVLTHHVPLDHCVQSKVHYCKEGAYLFIWVRIGCAEVIIDVMEIKNQLVNLIHFVVWLSFDCFQVEDLVQYFSFVSVCCRLSKIFCLILVESGVQEEVGHFKNALLWGLSQLTLLLV